jgi:hypothetical protein
MIHVVLAWQPHLYQLIEVLVCSDGQMYVNQLGQMLLVAPVDFRHGTVLLEPVTNGSQNGHCFPHIIPSTTASLRADS